VTSPIKSCEVEGKFSETSIIKIEFRSTMPEGRVDCLSILFTKHDITKSLYGEEAIKVYAARMYKKKKALYRRGRQFIDENIMLFLRIL